MDAAPPPREEAPAAAGALDGEAAGGAQEIGSEEADSALEAAANLADDRIAEAETAQPRPEAAAAAADEAAPEAAADDRGREAAVDDEGEDQGERPPPPAVDGGGPPPEDAAAAPPAEAGAAPTADVAAAPPAERVAAPPADAAAPPDTAAAPPVDVAAASPVDVAAAPQTDTVATPPADVAAPPAEVVAAPPDDVAPAPPADDDGAPPADAAAAPLTDVAVTPPAEAVAAPPADVTVALPAEAVAAPPDVASAPPAAATAAQPADITAAQPTDAAAPPEDAAAPTADAAAAPPDDGQPGAQVCASEGIAGETTTSSPGADVCDPREEVSSAVDPPGDVQRTGTDAEAADAETVAAPTVVEDVPRPDAAAATLAAEAAPPSVTNDDDDRSAAAEADAAAVAQHAAILAAQRALAAAQQRLSRDDAPAPLSPLVLSSQPAAETGSPEASAAGNWNVDDDDVLARARAMCADVKTTFGDDAPASPHILRETPRAVDMTLEKPAGLRKAAPAPPAAAHSPGDVGGDTVLQCARALVAAVNGPSTPPRRQKEGPKDGAPSSARAAVEDVDGALWKRLPHVGVNRGSSLVTTSDDCSRFIRPGDAVLVGGVECRVTKKGAVDRSSVEIAADWAGETATHVAFYVRRKPKAPPPPSEGQEHVGVDDEAAPAKRRFKAPQLKSKKTRPPPRTVAPPEAEAPAEALAPAPGRGKIEAPAPAPRRRKVEALASEEDDVQSQRSSEGFVGAVSPAAEGRRRALERLRAQNDERRRLSDEAAEQAELAAARKAEAHELADVARRKARKRAQVLREKKRAAAAAAKTLLHVEQAIANDRLAELADKHAGAAEERAALAADEFKREKRARADEGAKRSAEADRRREAARTDRRAAPTADEAPSARRRRTRAAADTAARLRSQAARARHVDEEQDRVLRAKLQAHKGRHSRGDAEAASPSSFASSLANFGPAASPAPGRASPSCVPPLEGGPFPGHERASLPLNLSSTSLPGLAKPASAGSNDRAAPPTTLSTSSHRGDDAKPSKAEALPALPGASPKKRSQKREPVWRQKPIPISMPYADPSPPKANDAARQRRRRRPQQKAQPNSPSLPPLPPLHASESPRKTLGAFKASLKQRLSQRLDAQQSAPDEVPPPDGADE
ncbi:hypothetical protein M885DRAFT_547712 [Pelagophyceae sp. CCMP2097]|nr:hypothetical protein M885DRAFT_547712 [Pelagophyceae sp. CCMP2097]